MRKRTQPKHSAPSVTPQPQEQIVVQEREYKVITPLFGGGALAGQRDEVTIIRGTEIRGHLRFWWRACFGGRYENVAKMKEDEDRIWGSAAQSQQEKGETENREEEKLEKPTVQMMVETLKPEAVKEFQIYKLQTDKKGKRQARPVNTALGYVAFPLQPSREELDAPTPPQVKPVFEGVHFRLTMTFPAERQTDIEGALWAWETFGGIGARTRRGFGALQLTKLGKDAPTDVPPGDDPMQWIREHIAAFQTKSEPQVKGKAPQNVPCLLPDMKKMQCIGPFDTARMAWEKAVEKLLHYRQYPHGRATQFGRTKWPEAETIHTFTAHGRKIDLSAKPPQKFPRAAFGLPIIFNFLGYPDLQKRPLQGKEKGHERLASPLILRPLMCKSHDDKKDVAIGLALVLENFSFPPEGIVFVEKDGTTHAADPHIKEGDVARIEPLDEADVLSDFIHYFGNTGEK